MWHATLIFGLLLGHVVRSEVSQSSPAEQIIKNSEIVNTTITKLSENASSTITKMIDDYQNLYIDVIAAPKLNQSHVTFKEMCETNGGNESYNTLVAAIEDMRKCFFDVVSFAELPAKIKKSKPHGELDTVFKEYCDKTGAMKGCVHKMLNNVDPCLYEHQRKSKYTVLEITDVILGFVCENEGDHIALFISEKGPECILSKQDGIKKCIQDRYPDDNTTNPFAELTPEEVYNFNFTDERDPGFSLAFNLNQCRTAYQVRKCVVDALTTCSGSTPANVVDSIFNLVHNSTQCSKFAMKEIDPNYNRGTSLFISFFSVIIPALTVLLVRTFNS